MNTQVDPSNVKPGEHAPVPSTRDELLIESLRAANRMSGLLNRIAAWAYSDKPAQSALDDLLARRFSDCSAVHLFIAANNLRVDLPPDIDGRGDDEDDDEI